MTGINYTGGSRNNHSHKSNHKRNNRYDPYQPRPNQFSNLLANRVVDNYKKHGTTRKKIQSLSKKMNFPEFDFSWATNSNNNAAEGDEDDFDESYESKPVSISNHLRWKEVERNDEINGRRRNDLVSKIRDIEVGGNGSGSNRYNQNLSLSEAQKVLAVQDWTETDSTLTLPLNLKPHRTTLHMKSTQSNNPTSSIRKHHRFNYTTEDEDEVKSYNPSNYSPKRFYSPEINDDVDQSTSKISRYNSTLAMDDLNAEIVRMKNEGEGVNSSKVHNHSNEKRVDLDSVNNREVEELQSEEAEDDILEFPSSTQYFKSNDIDPDQTTSNIKLSEHGFPLSIENQNSISVVAAVNQQRSPTPFDSTTTVPEIPISSLISSPQLSPYGTPTLNSDKTLSIQDSYYLALASKLSRDFFEPKESWWTSNWYDMEKMEVGLNEDCEKEEEEEEDFPSFSIITTTKPDSKSSVNSGVDFSIEPLNSNDLNDSGFFEISKSKKFFEIEDSLSDMEISEDEVELSSSLPFSFNQYSSTKPAVEGSKLNGFNLFEDEDSSGLF